MAKSSKAARRCKRSLRVEFFRRLARHPTDGRFPARDRRCAALGGVHAPVQVRPAHPLRGRPRAPRRTGVDRPGRFRRAEAPARTCAQPVLAAGGGGARGARRRTLPRRPARAPANLVRGPGRDRQPLPALARPAAALRAAPAQGPRRRSTGLEGARRRTGLLVARGEAAADRDGRRAGAAARPLARCQRGGSAAAPRRRRRGVGRARGDAARRAGGGQAGATGQRAASVQGLVAALLRRQGRGDRAPRRRRRALAALRHARAPRRRRASGPYAGALPAAALSAGRRLRRVDAGRPGALGLGRDARRAGNLEDEGPSGMVGRRLVPQPLTQKHKHKHKLKRVCGCLCVRSRLAFEFAFVGGRGLSLCLSLRSSLPPSRVSTIGPRPQAQNLNPPSRRSQYNSPTPAAVTIAEVMYNPRATCVSRSTSAYAAASPGWSWFSDSRRFRSRAVAYALAWKAMATTALAAPIPSAVSAAGRTHGLRVSAATPATGSAAAGTVASIGPTSMRASVTCPKRTSTKALVSSARP